MERVLVIEDDRTVRAMVVDRLKSRGFEVDEASDGREGSSLASVRQYDLVVCGVAIPKKDCYSLIRELRDDPSKRTTSVILVTGNMEREQIRAGTGVSADGYLVRPFTEKELFHAVDSCMTRRKAIEGFYRDKYRDAESLQKKYFFNKASGLPNANLLRKNVDEAYASLEDRLQCFVVSFSVDGYDAMHDYLGRHSIDDITKRIIENIKNTLDRSEELYELGENDFAILCYIHLIAEKVVGDPYFVARVDAILESVKIPVRFTKYDISLTASAGIQFCDTVESPDDVYSAIEGAKQARRYAELTGGNAYKKYTKELRRQLMERLSPVLRKHMFIRSEEAESGGSKESMTGDAETCRVFFLYPPNIISEKVIMDIIRNEFLAYLVNDYKAVINVLKKYPNSILFINIDTVLSEPEWEKYIVRLMSESATSRVRIGIITFYGNSDLARKYLFDIKIQCGFITLRTSYNQCKDMILKVLNAVEAIGKRKYIRISCIDMPSVSVCVIIRGRKYSGTVIDVSSAGMACTFEKDFHAYLEKNSIIDEIQLSLRGKLCLVKGEIVGKRYTENKDIVYIVMYGKYIDGTIREKIHSFIYLCLSEQIKKELGTGKANSQKSKSG